MPGDDARRFSTNNRGVGISEASGGFGSARPVWIRIDVIAHSAARFGAAGGLSATPNFLIRQDRDLKNPSAPVLSACIYYRTVRCRHASGWWQARVSRGTRKGEGGCRRGLRRRETIYERSARRRNGPSHGPWPCRGRRTNFGTEQPSNAKTPERWCRSHRSKCLKAGGAARGGPAFRSPQRRPYGR